MALGRAHGRDRHAGRGNAKCCSKLGIRLDPVDHVTQEQEFALRIHSVERGPSLCNLGQSVSLLLRAGLSVRLLESAIDGLDVGATAHKGFLGQPRYSAHGTSSEWRSVFILDLGDQCICGREGGIDVRGTGGNWRNLFRMHFQTG